MMNLIEIKGLFEMDTGAPSPTILSSDNELFIAFYAEKKSDFSNLHERNIVYDTGVFALKFNRYIRYSFGFPGSETLHFHPYAKLGLKPFAFYELKNSTIIADLEKIEMKHPYYNPERWKLYKHYILTFHDNMFECIAQNFEIREDNISLYNQAATILNELSNKHF